jgi:hypothetical protein
MYIEDAYQLLVLATTNFIQSLEAHNLSPVECTVEGDFTAGYIADRLQDDLGIKFQEDVADKLNGK